MKQYLVIPAFLLVVFAPLLCSSLPILAYTSSGVLFPSVNSKDCWTWNQTLPSETVHVLRAPIPYGELDIDPNLPSPPPSPPSLKHWFGTDETGRDLFVRLVFGLRNSAVFALASLLLCALLGITLGLVAGYWGGSFDFAFIHLSEVAVAFPLLPLAFIVTSFFQPTIALLVALRSLFGWYSFAGYMRLATKTWTSSSLLKSLTIAGLSKPRILFFHILPNSLPAVITLIPYHLAASIGFLATLDFVGLGILPPHASLGKILQEVHENPRAWWLMLFPTLLLTCITFLLIRLKKDHRNTEIRMDNKILTLCFETQ